MKEIEQQKTRTLKASLTNFAASHPRLLSIGIYAGVVWLSQQQWALYYIQSNNSWHLQRAGKRVKSETARKFED